MRLLRGDFSIQPVWDRSVAAASNPWIDAVLFAVLGGFFWAVGILGRRYGVEGAPERQKVVWSAFTSLISLLGTMLLPMLELAWARHGEHGAHQLLGDPEWCHRLPWIVAAGMVSGVGSLLAMYSLALAGRHTSSALVSVVQNGVFTAGAPVMITLAFGEATRAPTWLGVAAVCAGVPLMDAGVARLCTPWACPEDARENQKDALEDQKERGLDRAAPESKGHSAAPGRTSGALVVAAVAGLLWDIGNLGRRYGVRASPVALQRTEATLTFLVLNGCSCLAPFACLALVADGPARRREVLSDESFRRRMPTVAATGVLGGVGGLLCTLGLAVVGHDGGAAISTIANGVYTVCGALLIGALYRERPAPAQLCGVALVVLGIVLMGF